MANAIKVSGNVIWTGMFAQHVKVSSPAVQEVAHFPNLKKLTQPYQHS